jgi:hypothetical protein
VRRLTTSSVMVTALGALLGLTTGCSDDATSAADGASVRYDGGSTRPDGAPPAGDQGSTPDAKTGCQPACKANQICENSQCKDLPKQCPCPIESYCDLATNTCVAGCLGDTDCKAGRYCDGAKKCKDGCRVGECGQNEICDAQKRVCTCALGYHRCSGSCVKEGPTSCGPSCEICATDPNGKTSCSASGCTLTCDSGFKSCGGSCAQCPTANATAFTCSAGSCEASACDSGHHVCSGACELEDTDSCGASCASCKDSLQGACTAGACYEVLDLGYLPKITSCAERCAAMGKTCSDSCDVHYTRPNGTKYNYIAAGMYTQKGAYQPYGFFKSCSEKPPSGINSYRCCCSEKLTGTPKPDCLTHADCGATEFCWSKNSVCYPTSDSSCPPGYTYKGSCSNGKQICVHGGLPTGTVFKFAVPCPAGTHQRGGYYCSGETKICVPN